MMHRTLARATLALGCALLIAICASAQTRYDLLIQGGHVVDAKNGLSAIRDVAIVNHRIAEVASNIDASKARKVINAKGLYVTPGLVDIHVHVYAGTGEKNSYAGDNSVYPDGFTFRSGVTTVVDAGSSGWRDFPDFKSHVIDRAKTRVLAMLNIVGTGMRGIEIEQDLTSMDAKAAAAMALKYPGLIVGIKTAHYTGPEWTPVERAVEAGTLANIPVMVDFGTFVAQRPYEELVTKKLRPGDISTHMYIAAAPLLDKNGQVRPFLAEARKRGVIFDVGHGGGSFLFRQAAPAVRQGFVPDSISTDLHVFSMNAGMKDMLNVMSKFLNMGMRVDDVIAKSTWAPAREMHIEPLGTLSKGAAADVTLLRLEKGTFGFVDSFGARMVGTQRFSCEMTVRDGAVVWDLNGLSRRDWTALGKDYKAQGDDSWDGTLVHTVPAGK